MIINSYSKSRDINLVEKATKQNLTENTFGVPQTKVLLISFLTN